MTPAALSRLTWTADDRRAWLEAYAHARAIDRRRRRRERNLSAGVFINDGPDCYCACHRRLVYGSCPVCDSDVPRFSVHADLMGEES